MIYDEQPISEYTDLYGPMPGDLPPLAEDLEAHAARFPTAGPPHFNEMPEGVPPVAGSTADSEISGAELRVAREALGMSAKDLAHWLGVGARSVQRWEAQTPPMWVDSMIALLTEESERWVDVLARHRAEVTVHHSGWRLHDDQWVLPESWWHVVVGRARRRNPTLAVEWAD